MSIRTWILGIAATGVMAGAAVEAAAADVAKARLHDPDGAYVGAVGLVETPNGVLIHATLQNMPAGWHAFHIHETGKCEPPFKSAGGHYNPFDKAHGIKDPDGMHAGDLPNVFVPASGVNEFQALAPQVTLKEGAQNTLFDGDGSAIVMHMGADDYVSDPAGAAGARIACGVVEPGM